MKKLVPMLLVVVLLLSVVLTTVSAACLSDCDHLSYTYYTEYETITEDGYEVTYLVQKYYCPDCGERLEDLDHRIEMEREPVEEHEHEHEWEQHGTHAYYVTEYAYSAYCVQRWEVNVYDCACGEEWYDYDNAWLVEEEWHFYE